MFHNFVTVLYVDAGEPRKICRSLYTSCRLDSALCYLNEGIRQSNTTPGEYGDAKKQSKMEVPLSFIVIFLLPLVIRKLQLRAVDKKTRTPSVVPEGCEMSLIHPTTFSLTSRP